MNKEDFRLTNQHVSELRNELRSQPVLKTRHLLLPETTAFAALIWFLLLPSTQYEPVPQVKSTHKESPSYQELVLLEQEFESAFMKKKKAKKVPEKIQRWKKNKPDTLADRMANTRQRLEKLKVKINS